MQSVHHSPGVPIYLLQCLLHCDLPGEEHLLHVKWLQSLNYTHAASFTFPSSSFDVLCSASTFEAWHTRVVHGYSGMLNPKIYRKKRRRRRKNQQSNNGRSGFIQLSTFCYTFADHHDFARWPFGDKGAMVVQPIRVPKNAPKPRACVEVTIDLKGDPVALYLPYQLLCHDSRAPGDESGCSPSPLVRTSSPTSLPRKTQCTVLQSCDFHI